MADEQFDNIREKLETFGDPFIGGTLLDITYTARDMICESCGVLDPTALGDWHNQCREAMSHVQEKGTGHRVVVRVEQMAIYSSPSDE